MTFNRTLLAFYFLPFACCLLSGCAKLEYMEQALTLKAYADNKTQQRDYVEERDKVFDSLLAAIKDGTIDDYQHQDQIVADFGEPLIKKPMSYKDNDVERWLYRYQTKAFTSDKVYFIFDQQGALVEWSLVPASDV